MRAADGARQRPSVFLQLGDQPLQRVSSRHLLRDVINRCGGHSITAAVPVLAPRVEIEFVLAANPDVMIVESSEQSRHWGRFPQLSALRAAQVHVIDPDLVHRSTLRLLDGRGAICARIDAVRTKDTSTANAYSPRLTSYTGDQAATGRRHQRMNPEASRRRAPARSGEYRSGSATESSNNPG